MQKKTILLIIIIFISALVASLISGYYLLFFKNQKTTNSQVQGEKEFLDFLSQKKKLTQTNEEVSLVAVGHISCSREKAGFSILSLTNNHAPNLEEKDLKDTISFLENAGIKYISAGQNEQETYQPAYIEKKGIKFAFLAHNDTDVLPTYYEATTNHTGTAFMRIDEMTEMVNEAKQKSDFVIVSMHFGKE